MGVVGIAEEEIHHDDPPNVSDEIELPKLIDLPSSPRFVTMGLFPGIVEKPEEKKPAKKSKKKLPK
jgi:hypothetical protein